MLDFLRPMADDQEVIAVRGELDGRHVAAQLDEDGCLIGTPAFVAAIDELISQGTRVGIAGIVTGPASLQEDRIARATLLAPLDHGTGRLGGDPPHIDAVPADAEA